MRDADKSKEELIEELETARRQIAEYRAIADVRSDYVMRYDREGRHIYANRAALSAAWKKKAWMGLCSTSAFETGIRRPSPESCPGAILPLRW